MRVNVYTISVMLMTRDTLHVTRSTLGLHTAC